MKVSAEGPSCMAVAAAWHWRVITDCQTEDFKLIHMIENIGAMRREFILIFYFPWLAMSWCEAEDSCCRHVKHISFLLFSSCTTQLGSRAATASSQVWNWTAWIFSVLPLELFPSIKNFQFWLLKEKLVGISTLVVDNSEYEEKTKLGSIKLEQNSLYWQLQQQLQSSLSVSKCSDSAQLSYHSYLNFSSNQNHTRRDWGLRELKHPRAERNQHRPIIVKFALISLKPLIFLIVINIITGKVTSSTGTLRWPFIVIVGWNSQSELFVGRGEGGGEGVLG